MQILPFNEALKMINIEELTKLEAKVYEQFGSKYCSEGAWLSENFLHPLADKFDLSFVVIENGKLQAFTVGYKFAESWGHISRVAVDSDIQGQGVGYKLVLEQLNKMLEKGIKLITIENVSSNLKAENLYKKAGFSVIEDKNILDLYIELRKRPPEEYYGCTKKQTVLCYISGNLDCKEFLKENENSK